VKQAEQIAAEHLSDSHALFILPDEKWARRVSGVFANSLAQQFPTRAHAMLTRQSDGGFLVSVRAPLENKTGADELCRQFPTGGGRKAAAGINKLPADQMSAFRDAFTQAF
jgi:single-stranded DNA-specific DHH superfamily exonuclease